jgi:hypothetical protein
MKVVFYLMHPNTHQIKPYDTVQTNLFSSHIQIHTHLMNNKEPSVYKMHDAPYPVQSSMPGTEPFPNPACHIRKTNQAIFQGRSNTMSPLYSSIKQDGCAPQETTATDFNHFILCRHLCRSYFAWQLHCNPASKNIPKYLKHVV